MQIKCCDMRYAEFPRAKLVLTDPPYNIGFPGYDYYADNLTHEEYGTMLKKCREIGEILAVIQYPEETMRYVVPTLGVPDEVMAWCYNTNLSKAFRLINIYGGKPDYRKVLQPYKNITDKRIAARIAAGHKGSRSYDWFSDIQLVKNVSAEKTIHPCPIPEKLAERIILLLTSPGDMVIDPFSGGGTVGVAAKRLGREFMGSELSPEYAEIANARILNTCPNP